MKEFSLRKVEEEKGLFIHIISIETTHYVYVVYFSSHCNVFRRRREMRVNV